MRQKNNHATDNVGRNTNTDLGQHGFLEKSKTSSLKLSIPNLHVCVLVLSSCFENLSTSQVTTRALGECRPPSRHVIISKRENWDFFGIQTPSVG